MNVTATDAGGWGYVTVYACDGPRPATSNINIDAAGHDVPNLVTVNVGRSGTVCFYTSASTHLLADLAGTYEDGGGDRFVAVDPSRVLDTRNGVGGEPAAVVAGSTLTLQVTGRAGVPAGATAVTMNLTAVDAQGWGYATAFPCDRGQPEASNVNFVAGQTVPNLVTVKLSEVGTVCIYSYAATDLVADVAGYYHPDVAGAGYEAGVPTRVLDSRLQGPVLDTRPREVAVATGFTMNTGVTAAIVNLTVTETSGPGYATAYPCALTPPDASNVNYAAGQTVANQAVAKLAYNSTFCLVASATTHVIVDVFGVFTGRVGRVATLR